MSYGVIQWATGNVGAHSLRAIVANPKLHLVGARVYAAEKVGRDAGELCGIPAAGVLATDDVEEILALPADCVAYNALGETRDPERALEDICTILRSGKNVVSTAVSTYIYPSVLVSETQEQLEAACRSGGVSFHSTGINPGFSFDVFPITLSRIARRIDRIHITEVVDMSAYTSETIVHGFIGMGMPVGVDAPMDREKVTRGTSFHASMQMLSDAIGAELEDIQLRREKAPADAEIDLPWGRVETGCTAARRTRYSGIIGGEARIHYDIVWRVSDAVAPEWPRGDARYELAIEGDPSLRCHFDMKVESGRHISLVTAMHAVNAIPAVCRASSGVKTDLDLPHFGGGFFSGSETADQASKP